ncbi:MAG: flagellar hook-associated protein FlgK, partial [Gammaproteobacteria bacterium]
MASGILGSALSGLMAFQRSLDTTSHNIANVATEGYSRQRVELSTRPAQFTGAGYLGQGVNIEDITRSFDSFIVNQLRSSTSAFADVQQYSLLAARIDNIVADATTGMAPSLQNFFNAVHELADDPSSIPARQVMLSAAEILTQRFHTLNAQFESVRDQLNGDLKSITDEISSLAQAIADINNRIVAALGQTGSGPAPNDLLDQRDLLLKQLAEKIDVTVVPQQNGAVNVFIGKGQALVMGTDAQRLT